MNISKDHVETWILASGSRGPRHRFLLNRWFPGSLWTHSGARSRLALRREALPTEGIAWELAWAQGRAVLVNLWVLKGRLNKAVPRMKRLLSIIPYGYVLKKERIQDMTEQMLKAKWGSQ